MTNEGTIVVTGPTALRAIRCERRRHARLTWRPLGKVEQRHALASCVPNKSTIDLNDLAAHGIVPDETDGKIHVLVQSKELTRNSTVIACHEMGFNPPSGSTLMIERGLYVTSPELAIIQAGITGDLARTLVLALEFCGGYSLPDAEEYALCPFDSGRPISYYPSEPVMSPTALKRFLKHMPSCRGIRTANQAARYTLAGSVSPMESLVAAMYTLPFHLGGFAIKEAELNKEIMFNGEASAVSGMRRAYCDLYIPWAKSSLEYNGSIHDSRNWRIHDEKRDAGLEAMGITCFYLNDAQIRSPEALEVIARLVYRRGGRRFQCRADGFQNRCGRLLNALRTASGLSPA